MSFDFNNKIGFMEQNFSSYSNCLIVLIIISIALLNCFSVITSGGAKRIICWWVGFASKPFSFNPKHISHASFPFLGLITMAFRSPLPRTSSIISDFNFPSSSRKILPSVSAFLERFSSSRRRTYRTTKREWWWS